MIVEFHIESSRGTDVRTRVEFPARTPRAEIEWALEVWARTFGAYHASDNLVTISWRRVKAMIPRRSAEDQRPVTSRAGGSNPSGGVKRKKGCGT